MYKRQDVVKMKLYNVHIINLGEIEIIAGDMNYDNKITLTDVVKITLMLVGIK